MPFSRYDPELDPELDLIWARTPEQEARLIPANVTPETGSADMSFHVVKASARRVRCGGDEFRNTAMRFMDVPFVA